MVWRWHTELSEFLGECVFSYRKIVKPYSWLVVACEYADVTARNEPYQCMVQTALNWTMAYATEQGRGLDSFWELGVKSRGEETLPKKRCPPPPPFIWIYVNLWNLSQLGLGCFVSLLFIAWGGDILSCWCTALGYQQILSNGGSWFAIMRKETGNRETWTCLWWTKSYVQNGRIFHPEYAQKQTLSRSSCCSPFWGFLMVAGSLTTLC